MLGYLEMLGYLTIAWVSDDARVYGNAQVSGDAVLRNFDEIQNKNNLINIIGFEFSITITPSSINIGCKSYTIDQIDTVFDDEEYEGKSDIPLIKVMIEASLERILRLI